MSGIKSGCGDECGDVLVFNKVIPDCLKPVLKSGASFEDVLYQSLLKICKQQKEIEEIKTLVSQLNTTINTHIINKKCPSLKTIQVQCDKMKTKLSIAKKSIDGGVTFSSMSIEGELLADVESVLISEGINISYIGTYIVFSWINCDKHYQFELECLEPIVDEFLQTFCIPTCGDGGMLKVTTFIKNGNSLLESNNSEPYNSSFINALLSYGFENINDCWIILDSNSWDLVVECEYTEPLEYSIVVSCDAGCKISIPIGALKKDNSPLNTTVQTFTTLASLLSYLQTFSPNWQLSGNAISISDFHLWEFSYSCIDCPVIPNCNVCASYNGSVSGATVDIYYTVNGGIQEMISLSDGDCFEVPDGAIVEIVSIFPMGGGNSSEWSFASTNSCATINMNEPEFTNNFVTLTKESSNSCDGSMSCNIGISNCDLFSSTVNVYVDDVLQSSGTNYTKTDDGMGGIIIDSDIALAPISLCHTLPCSCAPYANSLTHTLKIVVVNQNGFYGEFIHSASFT